MDAWDSQRGLSMLKSTHVLLLFFFFRMKKARRFLLFPSFLFVCLGNEAKTEGELSVNFTHLFVLILLITCPPPPSLAAPGVAGRAKSPLNLLKTDRVYS